MHFAIRLKFSFFNGNDTIYHNVLRISLSQLSEILKKQM